MEKEIIYVGDPLCGWCYGFTEVFESVRNRYQEQAAISIVMGGLKVEESITINDKIKRMISKNWQTVMERTGQAFAVEDVNSLPNGIYNSEPPCRAVVTVRTLKPEAAIAYYKDLHKAMYIDVKNINDTNLFSELAERHGIASDIFQTHFNSDEMKSATQSDFDYSRDSGVLGFPAFILKDSDGHFVLNQGFKPLEMITKGIEDWFKGERMLIF